MAAHAWPCAYVPCVPCVPLQLSQAQISRDRVYIFSHVVPGASPSPSGWQALDYGFFWNEQQLESYRQIIRAYSELIMLQLYGHCHADYFRLLYAEEQAGLPGDSSCIPEYGCTVQAWVPPIGVIQEIPAISPLRGNNPAFRHYTYHPFTAVPITYDQFYLNLTMANDDAPVIIDNGGGWALEYNFRTEYKLPSLDVFAWNELYLALRNDIDQYHTWFSHRSSLATLWDEQKPELQNVDHHLGDLCAITNLNKSSNTACNRYFIWEPPHHHPPPTPFHWRTEHVVIVAVLVFIATVVITSSYHVRRQRNRRFQECDMYERKDFLTRA